MKELQKILKSNKKVALDSMMFIYFFEDHPKYAPKCELVFEGIEKGKNIATTSLLTYLEIINLPTKTKQNDLIGEYENIIKNYPNLFTQNLNFEILNETSRLIGDFKIHTLDAIQIATASYFGAGVFFTNDKILKRVETDVEIVVLGEVR